MALEKQTALLLELGTMGEGIPGLDPTPIIENIVAKSEAIRDKITLIQVKYDQYRARKKMTDEEAKAELKKEVKKTIDDYKEILKKQVEMVIAQIKAEWKKIKEALLAIPEDVISAIQNILVPPAITVPPAAPNPIYALEVAAQTKRMLLGILNTISPSLITLIGAATLILFELPEPVLIVGATIKALDMIINTIPV
jgi:NACalpha-BTF3-like transcription factor